MSDDLAELTAALEHRGAELRRAVTDYNDLLDAASRVLDLQGQGASVDLSPVDVDTTHAAALAALGSGNQWPRKIRNRI